MSFDSSNCAYYLRWTEFRQNKTPIWLNDSAQNGVEDAHIVRVGIHLVEKG